MANRKEETIQAIRDHKLIAILRGVPLDRVVDTAEALYRGGIRVLEVTYTAGEPATDAETAEKIRRLTGHFGSRLYVGAGTVLTPEQVKLTAEAGGVLIISPNADAAVIAETNALGLVSIPGVYTPTEIVQAYSQGADFAKLFPAGSMGPAYIKAIRAPLRHIPLLAVGGVDCGNMEEYWQAGVVGFGIGSNIVDLKAVKAGDYEAIERKAAMFVETVAKLR